MRLFQSSKQAAPLFNYACGGARCGGIWFQSSKQAAPLFNTDPHFCIFLQEGFQSSKQAAPLFNTARDVRPTGERKFQSSKQAAPLFNVGPMGEREEVTRVVSIQQAGGPSLQPMAVRSQRNSIRSLFQSSKQAAPLFNSGSGAIHLRES